MYRLHTREVLLLLLSSHKSLTYLQRIVNSFLCESRKRVVNFTSRHSLLLSSLAFISKVHTIFRNRKFSPSTFRLLFTVASFSFPFHCLQSHYFYFNFVFSFFNGLQHTNVHFKVHNSDHNFYLFNI